MADTYKQLYPVTRPEQHGGTILEGSGTAYIVKFKAEDGGDEFWIIRRAGAPSTTATDAPVGSLYFDLTNKIWYTKQDTADTWAAMNS